MFFHSLVATENLMDRVRGFVEFVRKSGPNRDRAGPDAKMSRDILRLAETSPHLLRDIGFEKVPGGQAPWENRWRAVQRPELELTETVVPALWDVICGR